MRASSARRHTMNTSIRWIVCFVALRNAQRNARMIWLWALYGLFYGSSIALHIATGGAHLSLSALYLYLCLSLFFLFFLPLSVTHQFDVSLYFFSFLWIFQFIYFFFKCFCRPRSLSPLRIYYFKQSSAKYERLCQLHHGTDQESATEMSR